VSRVDVRLVELGLAPSRAKAQAMIRAGEVEIASAGGWRAARSVSESARDARVIAGGETLRFVSRGGLKLDHALNRLGLDLEGARVIDVGQSTGGFTDCVLKRGAAAVLGVDVGRGQIHASLRGDARVTVLEGVNARKLADDTAVRAWIADGLALVVADLSFISLRLVIPELAKILPPGASALLLVKPQFEAGPEHLDGRGIVTSERVRDDVRADTARALTQNGLELLADFACALPGGDGNREIFVYARRV
jgi:23S rRNA (cytidine1920-2'-O)/16S rRNA (cytidine1409-2'-O)-methyltransferase